MALWRYNRDHDPETGKRLYESKDTPYPTGLYTNTSPDGIHWPARERLVHTHADGFGDTYTWMLDSLRGGYRLFGKRLYWDNRWASGKVRNGEPGTWVRLRHTCWSPDFASWSPHVPILPIDEHDRPRDQVYMNNGFVYDDMYLGFAQILHALDDWSMDLDLACSRDGEEWLRPPGARCIIPRGEGTAWDSGRMAIFPSAPVPREGRLHFYYTSAAQYHSPAREARDAARHRENPPACAWRRCARTGSPGCAPRARAGSSARGPCASTIPTCWSTSTPAAAGPAAWVSSTRAARHWPGTDRTTWSRSAGTTSATRYAGGTANR